MNYSQKKYSKVVLYAVRFKGYVNNKGEAIVTIEDSEGVEKPLKMTALARQKSPSGFSWGYAGSGPSALAHSMLSLLTTPSQANRYMHDFKEDFLVNLEFPNKNVFYAKDHPVEVWEISISDIKLWLSQKYVNEIKEEEIAEHSSLEEFAAIKAETNI